MINEIIRSDNRGFFDHGWLKTYHSFSFADYYDPKHINFGALRVLNDDLVQAKCGFGMHPHQNMEIITLPLFGQLEHEDSMGSKGVISAGEVQVMSAGTGLMHAERNPANEPVNLLQIWIFTMQKNVVPRYEQKRFDDYECKDKLQLLVSPDGRSSSLWIYQNAFISRINCSAKTSTTYSTFLEKNGIFLFVIDGSANILENSLNKRDSISVTNEKGLVIHSPEESYYVIIEVPMSY